MWKQISVDQSCVHAYAILELCNLSFVYIFSAVLHFVGHKETICYDVILLQQQDKQEHFHNDWLVLAFFWTVLMTRCIQISRCQLSGSVCLWKLSSVSEKLVVWLLQQRIRERGFWGSEHVSFFDVQTVVHQPLKLFISLPLKKAGSSFGAPSGSGWTGPLLHPPPTVTPSPILVKMVPPNQSVTRPPQRTAKWLAFVAKSLVDSRLILHARVVSTCRRPGHV